jgi:hypothetical protein
VASEGTEDIAPPTSQDTPPSPVPTDPVITTRFSTLTDPNFRDLIASSVLLLQDQQNGIDSVSPSTVIGGRAVATDNARRPPTGILDSSAWVSSASPAEPHPRVNTIDSILPRDSAIYIFSLFFDYVSTSVFI